MEKSMNGHKKRYFKSGRMKERCGLPSSASSLIRSMDKDQSSLPVDSSCDSMFAADTAAGGEDSIMWDISEKTISPLATPLSTTSHCARWRWPEYSPRGRSCRGYLWTMKIYGEVGSSTRGPHINSTIARPIPPSCLIFNDLLRSPLPKKGTLEIRVASAISMTRALPTMNGLGIGPKMRSALMTFTSRTWVKIFEPSV